MDKGNKFFVGVAVGNGNYEKRTESTIKYFVVSDKCKKLQVVHK